MEITRLVVGPLSTNTYILCEFDECIVVDPGADFDEIVETLGSRSVAAVVATHLHFDHVGAVQALVDRYGASFFASEEDWRVYRLINSMAEEWGFEIPEIPAPRPVGDRVWRLRVLYTPGHTPGSISLVGDGFVITGDTLFHRSVGRTDFPLGDWGALVSSICRLYELPRSYVVYPGHGPHSYIGDEALYNPFVNTEVCKEAGGRPIGGGF